MGHPNVDALLIVSVDRTCLLNIRNYFVYFYKCDNYTELTVAKINN